MTDPKPIAIRLRVYPDAHTTITALAGTDSIEAYLDRLIAADAVARGHTYQPRDDRRGKRGGGRRKK